VSVSKKRDWEKGKWAFGIKVFMPNGTMIESDLVKVPIERGEKVWKAIKQVIGLTKLDEEDEDSGVDEGLCYACDKMQRHINDGGSAWVAYRDVIDARTEESVSITTFYCNTPECSEDILHCCDLDIVMGSTCPSCGRKMRQQPPP